MTAKDFIEKYREEFLEYMETEYRNHNNWIQNVGVWFGYRFEEFIYDRVNLFKVDKDIIDDVCALLLNECNNLSYRHYEIPVAERPVKLLVAEKSEDRAAMRVISRDYTITGRVRAIPFNEIEVGKWWF